MSEFQEFMSGDTKETKKEDKRSISTIKALKINEVVNNSKSKIVDLPIPEELAIFHLDFVSRGELDAFVKDNRDDDALVKAWTRYRTALVIKFSKNPKFMEGIVGNYTLGMDNVHIPDINFVVGEKATADFVNLMTDLTNIEKKRMKDEENHAYEDYEEDEIESLV